MSSVAFKGFYGKYNIGDDAFLACASWGAQNIWKTDKHCFIVKEGAIHSEYGKALYARNKIVPGQRKMELICKTLSYTYTVWAGGSTFHGTDSVNKILSIQHSIGLNKLGAIGVSLGPFPTAKKYNEVKSFLKKFSFVSCRDKKSYEIALEMELPGKVIASFDLAALLPQIFTKKHVKREAIKKYVIGVSLCKSETHDPEKIEAEKKRVLFITRVLNELSHTTDFEVKFLNFRTNSELGDEHLSVDVDSNLPEKIETTHISTPKLPEAMWNHICECDFVLATRLHAGIFSCFAEVPFVQVEYHRKCTDFLDDVGYPAEFRIGDAQVSVDEAVNKIEQILTGSDQYNVKFLNEMQDKAFKNFGETAEFFK